MTVRPREAGTRAGAACACTPHTTGKARGITCRHRHSPSFTLVALGRAGRSGASRVPVPPWGRSTAAPAVYPANFTVEVAPCNALLLQSVSHLRPTASQQRAAGISALNDRRVRFPPLGADHRRHDVLRSTSPPTTQATTRSAGRCHSPGVQQPRDVRVPDPVPAGRVSVSSRERS